MRGCNFRNHLPINVPKCYGRKMLFSDKNFSKSSKLYYLQLGFYLSSTDIAENVKTLIQDWHNPNQNCITVKVSRRTQKVAFYLAFERSGLAIVSTDLGHIFGSNVGNEFGVMLRGKGLHKTEFAYDIARLQCLMIYKDLIEYSIVGNTKVLLLRSFHFISKLKAGDIIILDSTRTIRHLATCNFRALVKISFHSIHINLRDTSGKKYFLCLSVSLVLFWCLEKTPTFISNLRNVTRWLLQVK